MTRTRWLWLGPWLGLVLVLGLLRAGLVVNGLDDHRRAVRLPGPVVATVTDEASWHCGTRCVPLAPGQVLRFAFGRRVRVTFTNEGVAYPLVLITDDGRRRTMAPGACCWPVVTATAWEYRPA